MLEQGLIANLEVKLSDFGVDDYLQVPSQEIDFLPFLAPEVLDSKKHTMQSDVFSFGMVLCHLFSEGQEKPRHPQSVILSSHYLQIWDPRWKEIILQCTHRDASKRPSFSIILDLLTELNNSPPKDFF